MRLLKSVLLLTGIATTGAFAPAFATGYPDITTGVVSLPASQALSTTTQSTYVSYKITLTPSPSYSVHTFNPVYFTATTSVVSGSWGDNATFFEPLLPAGCVLAGATTVNCTFSPGLSSAGHYGPPASDPIVFTVVVKTPLAGAKIKLSSETTWYEPSPYCTSPPTFPLPAPYPPCYETGGVKWTYTPLTTPDPTVVDTYVPVAGATVTTGNQTGAATCTPGNKFVTIVKVPQPAQVGVNLNRVPIVDDDVPAINVFFSKIQIPDLSGDPQLFGVGTRWYDHDAKTKLVVNTLRRDKCTIGSGNGTLKDALLILKERVFYKPDIPYPAAPEPVPVYKPLLLCFVTSGPYPGQPCIVYAKVYTKFNLPRVANKLDYVGDHEWVIFSNENGRIALPIGN